MVVAFICQKMLLPLSNSCICQTISRGVVVAASFLLSSMILHHRLRRLRMMQVQAGGDIHGTKLLPFSSVSAVPCTHRFHVRLRLQLRKQKTHSAEQIETIASNLKMLKTRLHHYGHLFKHYTTPILLSFFGFGNVQYRNTFLRAMRNTLSPVLIHCTQTNGEQWEAVMLLHVRKGCVHAFYNNCNEQFISQLDQIMDLFKLSINVLQLESWKDPATIACVDRIQKGKFVYGNWKANRNATLRTEYETERRLIEERRRSVQVRDVTGREFTTGNMLELYHDWRNAQLEMQRLRAAFETSMRFLSHLQHNAVAHSEQLNQLMMTQYHSSPPGEPAVWPTALPSHNQIQSAIDTQNITMQNIANLRRNMLQTMFPVNMMPRSTSTNNASVNTASANTTSTTTRNSAPENASANDVIDLTNDPDTSVSPPVRSPTPLWYTSPTGIELRAHARNQSRLSVEPGVFSISNARELLHNAQVMGVQTIVRAIQPRPPANRYESDSDGTRLDDSNAMMVD